MMESDFLDHCRRASEETISEERSRAHRENVGRGEADRAKSELSTKTGRATRRSSRSSSALGFTPDTIIPPLVPIVEMAWAEGEISGDARSSSSSPANEALRKAAPPIGSSRRMARQPSTDVFARATRLIRAMLDTGSPKGGKLTADDLIKYSESIAPRPAASSEFARPRPRSGRRSRKLLTRSSRGGRATDRAHHSSRHPRRALDVFARGGTVTIDARRPRHGTRPCRRPHRYQDESPPALLRTIE